MTWFLKKAVNCNSSFATIQTRLLLLLINLKNSIWKKITYHDYLGFFWFKENWGLKKDKRLLGCDANQENSGQVFTVCEAKLLMNSFKLWMNTLFLMSLMKVFDANKCWSIFIQHNVLLMIYGCGWVMTLHWFQIFYIYYVTLNINIYIRLIVLWEIFWLFVLRRLTYEVWSVLHVVFISQNSVLTSFQFSITIFF